MWDGLQTSLRPLLDLLQLSWRPALEITILTVGIYYVFNYVRGTRGAPVFYGFVVLLLTLTLVAGLFKLQVLSWLLRNFIALSALAVLIIFQPELRLALSKLSLKNKKYREVTEFDKFLDSITQSIYRLSERRIGALVVMENQDSLEDMAFFNN